MDYNEYRLTASEYARILFFSVILTFGASELFYDTWVGLLGSVGCMLLMRRMTRQRRIEEQKRRLAAEFLDAMQIVSNSLLAGASMETAWKDAELEMSELHGENSLMGWELAQMNASLGVNLTLEKLLEDFADRSGIEDIQNFSEIFSFAKRSGGNMVSIIENTVEHMRAKIEVEQEIEILVAAKRLEQKLLNGIPLLILAYLRFTSRDYLEVLYGNLFGVLFMTAAMGAYLGAIALSERILRIRI